MTPVEIISLLRLAVSAATSIGLDIAHVRELMDANGGELTEENVKQLLEASQAAIDKL